MAAHRIVAHRPRRWVLSFVALVVLLASVVVLTAPSTTAAQAADPREGVVHEVTTEVDVTIHDADFPDADEHCSWSGGTANELTPADGAIQLGQGTPGVTYPSSAGPFVTSSGAAIAFSCDEYGICFSDTTNGSAAAGEATVEAMVGGLVRVTIPYAFEDVSGFINNTSSCQHQSGFRNGTIVIEAMPGRQECVTTPPSWYDGGNLIVVDRLCVTNHYTLEPPVALGGVINRSGPAPHPASFDASASHDPDGYIVDYTWDFGDGVRRVTTSPTTSYTYRTPGTYYPTVLVRDHTGLTDRFALTYDEGIEVHDETTETTARPDSEVHAAISGPSSAEVNEVVQFGSYGSWSRPDPITSYQWDFGDGTSTVTSAPTVSHAFGRVGAFTVTVTTETSSGLSDKASLRFPVFFPSADDFDIPIAPTPTTRPIFVP